MKTFLKLLFNIALACGALLAQGPAFAQFQPTKPVRIITSHSAGSGPDAALRALAEILSARWHQPVIIDNRPGGNAFIAVNAFISQPPDGHTLISLDSNVLTTHPYTFSKLPYDPAKDFETVRPILAARFFVVVAKTSRFKTLDDILAAAKAAPEHVTYGSWYVGSPGHLGVLNLQSMKNVRMTHVPYKDTNQLFAAVSAGDVDWALGTLASAGPMEQGGRLRFLAWTGAERNVTYPTVPTATESAGTRGYEAGGWNGLFVPRGTPMTVRAQIANDVGLALTSKAMVERYRAFGYDDLALSPEAFAQRIKAESGAWKKAIHDAGGLKLD
jgi:tripartite-type tricarboxylate transporter receptor subunit TctC